MPEQHGSVLKMWMSYLNTISETIETTNMDYTSWHFDNNEADANELIELVLKGQKRATASSLWSFQYDNEPIPQAGDLSIVTDWYGIAKCVIQTKRVNIVPYKDVTEDFAKVEGEGDGSLAYWRQGHEIYFGQECARMGKTFTDDMPVICEEFEVVFK